MKKIKNFAKKLFSAKRMKTLAMLLFCGTLATYAQNAAGDYTAGTDALATGRRRLPSMYLLWLSSAMPLPV